MFRTLVPNPFAALVAGSTAVALIGSAIFFAVCLGRVLR